ncbi:ubiquinone biosynthesis hydrox [Aureobasidium pullulans]|uniref:Ubiquinone biosynthesis monooxygenase COQ6, mitochondrial n=1 Tax=Aureobasidium pullulans TaxID=5580 RepID=A0A4S9CY22_AURPU|nr:ubiquinone biosynthesis hydrox [Aureobasidium pullulans]THZ09418.1 ubiquinone biosynthesis hydrox [Aureobasidium pullulans]THZ76817.1 ubiquinone biosynthesis hydrox [Aureobasidium pullulans]TIA00732.1 ubiquinone biosynthesis hydrox [Aureobasidium pullulans]TIA25606.1 ubiquinone biosynthesis hydrox [Aureobasidium pullulans]
MPLRLPRTPCEVSRVSSRYSNIFVTSRSFWSRTAPRAAPVPTGPEIYDVVCVGGGPAGLSLLGALRASPKTANLKIALVEGQDLNKPQIQAESTTFSNRCSSLTPGSVKFLNEIGAWNHIATSRVQPYQAMQVWDGVSGSSISFDPSTTSSTVPDTVATMTENTNLTSALLARLGTLPPIDIMDKTRVEGIELGKETEKMDLSNWPVVSLNNSRKLAARLLIGADGANSPVRTFAGIPSRGWDYNRHGVVATVQVEGANWGAHGPRTAYQRFLPTGPVALLPLPGNVATLVWSTTPEKAALLKSLSSTDFIAMVNAAFRLLPVDLDYLHTMKSGHADEYAWREASTAFNSERIPQKISAVQDGSVASFPLRMRHADTYTGHRVALLGDAAHTIHPLAGQGLNQGLGDARSLAKHINFSLAVGKDIGSNWALDAYNSEQWAKNNAMLGTVDKLHKLYSAGSGPVVWARSLGLDAVDKMGFLKSFFMRQAAGT